MVRLGKAPSHVVAASGEASEKIYGDYLRFTEETGLLDKNTPKSNNQDKP